MTSIAKRIDLQSLINQRNEFIAIADGVLANIERMSTGDKISAQAWRRVVDLASASISYQGFTLHNLGATPATVIDGILWIDYLKITGLWDHLPQRYRAQFIRWRNDKGKDVLPFTDDNVRQVITQLHDRRYDWLAERIRDVFSIRSHRHKSTGAHAIGPRIVLIESHGRPTDAQVRDIESVVYHVMGATVPHEDIRLNLRGWFSHGVYGQPIMENEYMRLRTFKNGNVHVTWTDEGKVAVERMNDVLALGAERSLGRAGGK